ncbi:MAG TPA: phospholipase D-like domain-containing protein, partial [Candidatus Eremiobacteraeota bacterium]|nr:phospholipase D-like domain-containing protein [Candidatus Eremiobacteraeota bacterium]
MKIDANKILTNTGTLKSSKKKSEVELAPQDGVLLGRASDTAESLIMKGPATINKEDSKSTETGVFEEAFEKGNIDDRLGVSVQVMKDGGLDFLANMIKSAKKSIDLKIYIMTGNEEKTMSALLDAAKRGVKVRVMVEQTPFYWVKDSNEENPSQVAIDQLTAAGAEVKWTNPKYSFSRVTHEKSIVIDGNKGMILTGNLGASANTNLDIGAILLKDPKTVKDLATVFNYDYDRLNEQDKNLMDMIGGTELVVSPDNSRSKITDLIDSAKKSLVIMNQALSDEKLTLQILEKHREGVDVEVIMSDTLIGEGNLSSSTFLKSKGVKIKYMENPYLHAKAIAVDAKDDDPSDDVAYIGSQNFSTAAIDKNREMGVIFPDPNKGVLNLVNKYYPNTEEVPDKQISASEIYTGGLLKKAIKLAEESIIMSAVMITDNSIVKSLIKAKEDGKDVKVIIPDKPFGDKPMNEKAIQELQEAGVPLKIAGKNDNIEGTTLVVDNCRAIISNEGLTWTALNKAHNLGMVAIDPGEVSDFGKILNAQFKGEILDAASLDKDIIAGNAKKDRTLNVIKKAKSVIEIESKEVSDLSVLGILKKKISDGVKVKILCSDSKKNRENLKELIDCGADVVFDTSKPIGSNYINVDNQEIIVGGGNLGFNSLKKGGGIGVIIQDKEVIKKSDPDFSKNWVRGKVYSAEKEVHLEKKIIAVRDGVDGTALSSMLSKAKYGIPVSIKAEQVFGSPIDKSVENVNRALHNIVKLDPSNEDDAKKLSRHFDVFEIDEAVKYQENLRNVLNSLPEGENLVNFI